MIKSVKVACAIKRLKRSFSLVIISKLRYVKILNGLLRYQAKTVRKSHMTSLNLFSRIMANNMFTNLN